MLKPTERLTSLKISTGKKGSYIVEAVITLPVFIIASVVMVSILRFYAVIEESNFILANEMRREALQAKFMDGGMLFEGRTYRKIASKDKCIEELTINDYLYREDYFQIDEVIFLDYDMTMHVNNPIGLASRAKFDLSLMTRAYVGKIRDLDPMSDAELAGDDSVPVYVFPKMGEKYHSKNCTYVKASYTSSPLTSKIRNEYGSCSVCHSSNAALGTTVYYFPQYGDAYHLRGCGVLSRHYIEMEKSIAVERGYTPCSKCGGS